MPQHWETHQGSSSVSQDGTVTHVRTFRYYSESAGTRPAWSVLGISIAKYDPHPDDATCLAVDVQASAVSDELGWFEVSYTYTNRVFDSGVTATDGGAGGTGPGSQDPTVQPNPTLRTPTVRWGTVTRQVPLVRDYDSPRKLLANSAGTPFEGVVVDVINPTITISLNRADGVDIATKQITYCGKLNDAPFSVIAAHGPYDTGTLRCNNWTGSRQFEQGYGWYTSCDVEFEWSPKGWELELLDRGTHVRAGIGPDGNYRVERVVSPTGQTINEPVNLNGSGARLPAGSPPVYLTFYPYQWVSFTNIFS